MLKRAFDLSVAILLLIVLAPLMVAVSLLVLIDLGSPVLYVQCRPGRCAIPFRLLKFRTMLEGDHLPDADRLTRFGRFLRSSSLDELPELWNVVKGDMSLVGPRPLLIDYLPLYNAVQARRHEVKPGLTGWAQVNGRNALSWPEKFALDVWYVDNRTFWLDLQILLKTITIVLRRDGISEDGEVTMSKFTGNES